IQIERKIVETLICTLLGAVAINAVWMLTYMSGVTCPYHCAKDCLDHGILL
ncbi:hypothetical protein RYX36_033475, partial [Vicia faba]